MCACALLRITNLVHSNARWSKMQMGAMLYVRFNFYQPSNIIKSVLDGRGTYVVYMRPNSEMQMATG